MIKARAGGLPATGNSGRVNQHSGFYSQVFGNCSNSCAHSVMFERFKLRKRLA